MKPMTRAYTHRIDPHYSHDHADLFFDGWEYITTLSPNYPVSLTEGLYKHQNEEAAKDVERQLNSRL